MKAIIAVTLTVQHAGATHPLTAHCLLACTPMGAGIAPLAPFSPSELFRCLPYSHPQLLPCPTPAPPGSPVHYLSPLLFMWPMEVCSQAPSTVGIMQHLSMYFGLHHDTFRHQTCCCTCLSSRKHMLSPCRFSMRSIPGSLGTARSMYSQGSLKAEPLCMSLPSQ